MRIIFEPNHTPIIGRYKNAVVEDPTTGILYLYDECGTYVNIPKANYGEHEFDNEDVILVEHNLNRYPAISLIDENGDEIVGSINHASKNEFTVTFSEPLTGVVSIT